MAELESKEARRQFLVAELARLKREFGNKSNSEEINQEMLKLETELYEIDPPAGFEKK